MIGREEELRQYRERVPFFFALVLLSMGIIATRVFYLQILKGEELRRYSEANRLKKEKLLPTRGIIYDRDGRVIVDSRASFDVVLFSQYYPFKREDLHKRLAAALDMPLDDLLGKLQKTRRRAAFHSVLLRADVTKDIIAAIEMDAEGFPGVDIEATVRRRYPFKELSAQVLGYVGEVDPADLKKNSNFSAGDYIGRRGIERRYDKHLRGVNGVGFVEVDARGHRRRTDDTERLLGYVTQTDPEPGDNLHLTIDADLSLAAKKAMEEHEFTGSVVAMDPRSGEILALINNPAYNPDDISGREIDPKIWSALVRNTDKPLRNRAIQDHYPPGSTFKLFLAVAGLAEGLITDKHTTNCNGSMKFGRRRFNCWKRHGKVDFYRSIRESCDVFYYELGDMLGVEGIAKYARLFGMGQPTGIRLRGEQPGIIPDEEWKLRNFKEPWQAGETLSVAIGQGFVTVTPLQLANAYAALANGGFVYRPYIVKRIERRDGKILREFQPELARRIDVPSEVFEHVKEGLFQVVNAPWGTGARSRSPYTVLSGKTGTAQVVRFADIAKIKCEEQERRFRHHGLFAGYAPRENPEIVVAAVAEHACHGSSAGPIVKAVVDAYMEKKMRLAGNDPKEISKRNWEKIQEYLKKSPLGVRRVVAKKPDPEPEVIAEPPVEEPAEGTGGEG